MTMSARLFEMPRLTEVNAVPSHRSPYEADPEFEGQPMLKHEMPLS